jgi:hypothetical protein
MHQGVNALMVIFLFGIGLALATTGLSLFKTTSSKVASVISNAILIIFY